MERNYHFGGEGTESDNEGAIFLPISIFNNGILSSLEAITKYTKEVLGLSYKEISIILNRNERTIWGAYNSAKSKMADEFILDTSTVVVPISVVKDRSVSVLESITEYLRETYGLRFCKIASMLNRNDRTVWTVYNRAKKKRGKYAN